MATFTFNSAPDNTTNATFCTWAQVVHDSFLAAGWVQSSDTGQVTISTMTNPATANTVAGYEVWRLDDAQQATAPIFVKIEYGRGYIPNPCGAVWFTVGQSSNGTGTLGSVLMARAQSNSLGTGATTAQVPGYASGDGHSIALVPWPSYVGAQGWAFYLERSRDTAGEATTSGFLIIFESGEQHKVIVVGNGGTTSAKYASSTLLPISLPGVINGGAHNAGATLSADGTTAPVLPVPCMAPGVVPWVSNLITVVYPGDAGAVSVITAATINGATRTYRAFTNFNFTAGSVAVDTTSSALPAILWED